MNRYQRMFDRLSARGEGAFGAFLMLGDPDLAGSAARLDAAVEGGADMIEVGIPFSDPVADGPTIQAAATRALGVGITPPDCLQLIADLRARHPDIPIGILTYANLVISPGLEAFYRAAADAGTDSVLVADVPHLEIAPFAAAARKVGVDPVMIAAPNTPEPALAEIAHIGGGYTYCVARAGVTGADRALNLDHRALFDTLARNLAPPPILGFGISTPDHVRAAIAAGAAGVICGSAIVSLCERGDMAALRDFVARMKAATRPSPAL